MANAKIREINQKLKQLRTTWPIWENVTSLKGYSGVRKHDIRAAYQRLSEPRTDCKKPKIPAIAAGDSIWTQNKLSIATEYIRKGFSKTMIPDERTIISDDLWGMKEEDTKEHINPKPNTK